MYRVLKKNGVINGVDVFCVFFLEDAVKKEHDICKISCSVKLGYGHLVGADTMGRSRAS